MEASVILQRGGCELQHRPNETKCTTVYLANRVLADWGLFLSWKPWFHFSGQLNGLVARGMCTCVCVCACTCVSTQQFVALKNTVYSRTVFLQNKLSACMWRSILSSLPLIGSFRQSQPGIQSCGCGRDAGLEWQRTWTGQAVHNSHVWLILRRPGQ